MVMAGANIIHNRTPVLDIKQNAYNMVALMSNFCKSLYLCIKISPDGASAAGAAE